jgi:hypothetical protein
MTNKNGMRSDDTNNTFSLIAGPFQKHVEDLRDAKANIRPTHSFRSH